MLQETLLCPQQYKESQKDQGGYYPCLAYVGSKSLKSCPALCNSMGCNLPDSPVHGILQARILEWVTVPSSRDLLAPPGKPIHALLLLLSRFTHVRLCATPQTAAYRASPSLGFSRQEHWRGLPFPSPMHESEKWKWSHWVMSGPCLSSGLISLALTFAEIRAVG